MTSVSSDRPDRKPTPAAASPGTDDRLEEFHRRREAVREHMGGADRVAALHARGRRTVRDRISAFLDPDSFEEVGTFARSEREPDRHGTPGDGKIGGHGSVGGKPVTVAGDDITVKRGSSSLIGSRRLHRLYEQALEQGNPFVYFGETGGARIPDTLGSEGFSNVPGPIGFAQRRRRIPMATVIVGESFGGSSFVSALSDLVVQVRGTCLAVTSPRVIEVATGEGIDPQELGGADVHERLTGQIDLAVEDEDEAFDVVRRFLDFLPPNAWTPSERRQAHRPVERDPAIAELVPTSRRRAYDMRRVIARIADGDVLELRPRFGRSLLTILGRVDGQPVGFIASQPSYQAGVLGPDACDKATRFLCMCDAYDLPVIFLQDTPGFLVGRQVEHSRLLYKAIQFLQALALSRTPKLTVVVRKAFGLAYYSLCGNDMGAHLLCAWPGAEIGFMDPDVGANVVHGRRLQELDEETRAATLAELSQAMAASTDPYGIAGVMKVDEVIDPADTRVVLADALRRLSGRSYEPGTSRPLASWPTCW